MFEAGFTYKIKGVDKYLTCVEALGAGRYYRAYVADKLDGEWYPVEGFDTADHPFAGKANMTFEDGVTPWSGQVSHGEMIREVNDERMVLDPNNLMFLYQGISDADNRGDYGRLSYKLGPPPRRQGRINIPRQRLIRLLQWEMAFVIARNAYPALRAFLQGKGPTTLCNENEESFTCSWVD